MKLRTILVSLIILPPGISAEPVVIIDREQVNIREDATTQARRIEILHRGDHVEELLRSVGWIQVRLADGRLGWVHADLVQERYLVEGQGVRVRSGPTTGDGAVTMVYKGQELGKLGHRGTWLNVELADGRSGWIHSKFVRRKTIEDVKAVMPSVSVPESPSPPAKVAEFPEPDPEFGVGEVPFALRKNPYSEGLQLEAAGDYAAALKQFEEVLAEDPRNVNALYHAAQAHIQLGQLDEASALLYGAVKHSGGRRDLYLTMSEVYRRRAMPDSAAKYEQLFSGEQSRDRPAASSESPEPLGEISEPAALSETSGEGSRVEEPQIAGELDVMEGLSDIGDAVPSEAVGRSSDEDTGSDRLHLFAIGSAALVVILVAAIWVGIRLGRGGESDGGKKKGPAKRRENAGFSKVLNEESLAASEGRVTSEEEAELDRQIDAKWLELRQSSELFAPVEEGQAGEEGQLNSILDHVEALREALDLQDERATMYADVVRLQNMKIESMNEEIRLLRKQRKA